MYVNLLCEFDISLQSVGGECVFDVLSHFVGSIEKKSSIRFVKFSFDGASDRGRWRTGRRLCCQHRAGSAVGKVVLVDKSAFCGWKFHQGNQRHQRCRDTDPEDQESGGDLQCQCLLVITFILFCNVPCECHYFSMFRRNATQECTSKNAQECTRSPGWFSSCLEVVLWLPLIAS